jgi:hypothetical protein
MGYVANNEWVVDQMNRFIESAPVVITIYYNTPTITVIITQSRQRLLTLVVAR